jgi:hypothetical protein
LYAEQAKTGAPWLGDAAGLEYFLTARSIAELAPMLDGFWQDVRCRDVCGRPTDAGDQPYAEALPDRQSRRRPRDLFTRVRPSVGDPERHPHSALRVVSLTPREPIAPNPCSAGAH